jgi:hypothetical protein
MAYQAADHERWKTLDFVLGVKVSLSEQHPRYNYVEICEVLQGIYPKDYYWTGNHPCCLCNATPILMPQSDFEKSLAGEKIKAIQITEMPENFNKFVKDNYERFSNYKRMPNFIADNPKIIDKIIK